MCKMTPKLLYLVFTVVITFEGTRGNVETGSPLRTKHVREVFPTSLLFLLNRRPTSGLGYKNITPVPVSPVPLSPSAPVEPFAQLPPSIPAIPNTPVSPSIPYSPEAPVVPSNGIRPNSFYPTVSYRQNVQQATQISTSGQLSYDNPSNGNRKILNIVHVHPRPQPVLLSCQTSQTTLPETLITNPAEIDNKVTEKSKDVSTNSFNPKDIPFEPVKNIEASPIPVQPKITEVVPSQATNKDSETEGNKDLDKSKNSFQINPKDIPFEPVKNIEASPIPVKPKNTEVPSHATNVNSDTKENKDLDKSENSFQINPKDIPFEPVKNIEASPIPVQPKETDVVPSQATNVNSASPIAQTSEEGKNPDLISSAGNNEADATPVKSQIKPEPSEEKAAVSDSKNTPDVSSSASEHNIPDEATKTEEPQNPLKDLILNGNPSNENADREESKKAEDSENKADTQNDSTSYESPSDETHLASTYDESKYTALPEESPSESTEHEPEATSSDNTNSQSTDIQSENSSATDSNTELNNGPTSEETKSSENTQYNSSETGEGISSAGLEEIQNHQGTVNEN